MYQSIKRHTCGVSYGILNRKVDTVDLAFLTIKWGTAFDQDDLNALKRAVAANTTGPIRFICLTDDSTGLDHDIESYPIPEFDLYTDTPKVGIWPKISLFHPVVATYAECVVFLDIDTVVVGNLDDLCHDPADALVMLGAGPRWRNMDVNLPALPASAFMTYRPKNHMQIFNHFKQNKAEITKTFLLEQQYVGAQAAKVTHYPIPWVQSFKYHLRRQYIVDLFTAPLAPNAETKLVAFHGFPRPFDVANTKSKWANEGRCGLHRPSWLQAYYRTYSDRNF